MNIGVIGLGYWGPNIVRNFIMNENIDKVICCDTSENQINKIKRIFHGIQTTMDYMSIMKDPEIDAVAIVTPVDTHYKLAKIALEHNKHILVEKPFTATAAQSEELLKIAKEKKRIVMVDHTFLYTSSVKKIKSLVVSGEIGSIYYFDSVRINLGLFQRDVNVVWDLAPHDFSIMSYILDKKPVSLRAMGADHVGSGLEDIAYVHIDFGDNLIAHFHLNWLSPVKIRKILIAGSKKMIVYDDMENSEKIKVYSKGIDVKDKEDEYRKLINYRIGDVFSPVLDNVEALKELIDDFISSIKNNTKPISSGEEGLKVVKILEATQKSIKTGETIYL